MPDYATLADPAHRITACNDTRLTDKQQAACLACIRIRRRDACLKATAATYYGVDVQSCTWCGSARRAGGMPADCTCCTACETLYS